MVFSYYEFFSAFWQRINTERCTRLQMKEGLISIQQERAIKAKSVMRFCGHDRPRRSRAPLDIVARVINVCKSGAKKTDIMYKANLSHVMLKHYLQIVVRADLVSNTRQEATYSITAKGLTFLRDYEELVRSKQIYSDK